MSEELPAPDEVSAMQFSLIDAAKALQHAAQYATPELAAFYKRRAGEVFAVISSLSRLDCAAIRKGETP